MLYNECKCMWLPHALLILRSLLVFNMRFLYESSVFSLPPVDFLRAFRRG